MLEIPNYEFIGISRIEIPKNDSDFTPKNDYGIWVLRKFLPGILSQYEKNKEKINYLYNYYLGKQDIETKRRLYNKDNLNNNKIKENHAFRQVDFKKSYICGENRKYTNKSNVVNDDILYLDRYLADCDFFTKDTELKEWVFSTGIGITYTIPRTDIIKEVGTDNITGQPIYQYDFDIENNAPFEHYTIDPRYNFVVYSSGYNSQPLFCVSITSEDISKDDDITPRIVQNVFIETRYCSFKLQTTKDYKRYLTELEFLGDKPISYIPMVEHRAYKERIGIVELNREMFNAINTLNSSISDMIIDKVNEVFVFKNINISKEKVREMLRAGTILLKDNPNGNSKADLNKLPLEIPFEGLNVYYNKLVTTAYDIAGVPLASNSTSHTGDTGQAKLTGGGWDNANAIAKGNIKLFLESDREVLKLMLQFCKLTPNCPLKDISESQIDIRYTLNLNYNFLAKAQGINYLYSTNMPKDMIIEFSDSFNDIQTKASAWEKNDREMKELENGNSTQTETE